MKSKEREPTIKIWLLIDLIHKNKKNWRDMGMNYKRFPTSNKSQRERETLKKYQWRGRILNQNRPIFYGPGLVFKVNDKEEECYDLLRIYYLLWITI